MAEPRVEALGHVGVALDARSLVLAVLLPAQHVLELLEALYHQNPVALNERQLLEVLVDVRDVSGHHLSRIVAGVHSALLVVQRYLSLAGVRLLHGVQRLLIEPALVSDVLERWSLQRVEVLPQLVRSVGVVLSLEPLGFLMFLGYLRSLGSLDVGSRSRFVLFRAPIKETVVIMTAVDLVGVCSGYALVRTSLVLSILLVLG